MGSQKRVVVINGKAILVEDYFSVQNAIELAIGRWNDYIREMTEYVKQNGMTKEYIDNKEMLYDEIKEIKVYDLL